MKSRSDHSQGEVHTDKHFFGTRVQKFPHHICWRYENARLICAARARSHVLLVLVGILTHEVTHLQGALLTLFSHKNTKIFFAIFVGYLFR
jgi:hypothetical protein